MMKLPHNSTVSKIVLGYDGQIKLMVNTVNDEKWSKADFEQLERCKIAYLEEKLGYKIVTLESLIKHDDYEKLLDETTE